MIFVRPYDAPKGFFSDLPAGFVRGAVRILSAPASAPMPTSIGDIIAVGGTNEHDAVPPWQDIGFSKRGYSISRHAREETFDVDQIIGQISPVHIADYVLEIDMDEAEVHASGIMSPTPGVYSAHHIAVMMLEAQTMRVTALVLDSAFLQPAETSFTGPKSYVRLTWRSTIGGVQLVSV